MSHRSIVIYGPQGCGKTTHAEELRQFYELETVVDDWDGVSPYPTEGALVLTNTAEAHFTGGTQHKHFGAAMREMNAEARADEQA